MNLKKKIIIICVVVVLLLAIGIGLFFFLNRAKEYTVTFNTNGGSQIEPLKLKENDIVKLPQEPTKEGYTFLYWVNQDGKTVLKSFRITKDIVLTAEWAEEGAETVTVTFDTDGGSQISNLEVIKGGKVILPDNPTKDGYTFKRWVYNGNEFDKEMAIEEDITIKAEWEKKEEDKKEEEKKEEKKEESKPGNVDATGISLNKDKLELIIGKTGSLTAIVTPDNAKDKSVTWSSSNPDVISVDGSGNVKANKIGQATITAKTYNGKTATATVYSDVESITLSVSTQFITNYDGTKSTNLTVTTTPNIDASLIKWSAPDATGQNAAAYFSGSGKSATITARNAYGSTYSQIPVTVSVGRKTSNKVVIYVEPELKLTFTKGLLQTVGTDPSRREYYVKNGVQAEISSGAPVSSWDYSSGSHLMSKPSKQDTKFTFTAKNDGDANEAFTLTATTKAGQKKTMRIKIIVT